jgi:hypothetical protein
MASSEPVLDNPDLGAIYAALDPLMDTLERHRRWNIGFMIPATIVVAPCAGLWTAIETASFFREPAWLTLTVAAMVFVFATIAAIFTVYRFFDRDYRMFCKRRYNREFARMLRMRYDPLGSFFVNELHHHYVLPPYRLCLAEDSLTFRHKGRQIRMQEVLFTLAGIYETTFLNRKSLTGKRGLVIRIPSRRYFKDHVLVVPKRWVASDRDRRRFIDLQHYERAPFGNHKFAERYYVMTENPVTAHLVFDHAFIERILSFEKAVGAKSLSFSFHNDEIVIYADHAKNFLELGGLFQPPRLERAKDIIDELRLLTSLVDSFDLNEFTGV